MLSKDDPHVAIIEDNTDGFVAGTMAATASGMITAYDLPELTTQRISPSTTLDVVEVYPYVPYIQYLLSGSVVMSIFMMVMIGGGDHFIDDKSRGLHEEYLVTPITKLELVLGFTISGAIKAVIAAVVVVTIGSADRSASAQRIRAATVDAADGRGCHHIDGTREHDVPAHGANDR